MASGYIHRTAIIGDPPESRAFSDSQSVYYPAIMFTARIEAFVTVDAGTERATFVGDRSWLMKHVHIGHDAIVGPDCELAPHCSVGGHVILGRSVRVGQGALFKPYVKVGHESRIGMGAVVICDVPPGEVWAGNPARCIHSSSREIGPLERRSWDDIQLYEGYDAAREYYEQSYDGWPNQVTLDAGDENKQRPDNDESKREYLRLTPHHWRECGVFPGCCSTCDPATIQNPDDLADGVWEKRRPFQEDGHLAADAYDDHR